MVKMDRDATTGLLPVAAYVACRPMTETPQGPESPPPARRRLRLPRLSIGWRLTLGLAAVAAVLIIGEELAARTTREALDAVRGMQNEHEPLASSANAVLEKLLAFDGVVSEFMQARSGADFSRDHRRRRCPRARRRQLLRHRPRAGRRRGRRAARAAHPPHRQRRTARQPRRAARAMERYAPGGTQPHDQRIVSAGGTGLAISGTQVVATRSLAELESAIKAVRGDVTTARVIARREHDFMAPARRPPGGIARLPRRAWLSLVRQDFQDAVHLRVQTARYDAQSAADWHGLLEDSAALVAGVQEQLQKPARPGWSGPRSTPPAPPRRPSTRCAPAPPRCWCCCCWSRCCWR